MVPGVVPVPGAGVGVRRQDRILPIVIQPPEINIGVIPPGKVVRGEVEIRNIGDEPITILRSTPSCQCTSVDLAGEVIQPGTAIMLTADFDPGYRLGVRNAKIQLIFKGYDQVIEVPVLAEVAMAVRATPSMIVNQDPITREFIDSAEYTVESVDGVPFRILSVHGEAPAYVDFDPARDAPRPSYRLRFDFSRYNASCLDEEGRVMPMFLLIETDHPACPVFDVRLRCECTLYERTEPGQNWTLSERRALLGVLEPGASREFTVQLKWRPGTIPNESVQSVTSNSAQFTSELLESYVEDGLQTFRLRITASPSHRGVLYDTVRFRSPTHDMSMLIIGLVREGAGEGVPEDADPPSGM